MVTEGTNGSDFPGGRRDGAAPQSTERARFEFVCATVEQHTTISFVTDTKAKTPTLRGPSSASRESSVVLSAARRGGHDAHDEARRRREPDDPLDIRGRDRARTHRSWPRDGVNYTETIGDSTSKRTQFRGCEDRDGRRQHPPRDVATPAKGASRT
jgi:hypothetical protein